jgi:pimeloyl-ACP methyl ester carboxylesterase
MIIDESKFIKLGDVNQFLIIRSDNIKNPVLLLLHGGTTETAHFVKFNHNLEKYFTVVYWDQRGEGKSYQKNSDNKLLTLERYVEDIHELTNYLKNKFQKEKIYLLGHSLGTLLGMKAVEKYPNDYISYISISQVADPIQSDNIAYDSLLATSKEKGNTKDVDKILSIDRVTKDNILYLNFTKRTNELIQLSIKYGGLYHQASFFKMLKISLFPILTLKEYSFKDKIRALKQHEERILFYYQNNLIDNITKIKVPVYFSVRITNSCKYLSWVISIKILVLIQ